MTCSVIPAIRRIAAVALLLFPFATPAQADPVQAIDARGTALQLMQPAQRIVTLST